MNYKFLTLLISSVSLIHGLQAMDLEDEIDLKEAIRLSLQGQQAAVKPLQGQELPPYVDDDEVVDPDLQKAINASYRENFLPEEVLPGAFPIAHPLQMPMPQHVEPVVRHNGVPNGPDDELARVLAASRKEFEEKQGKQAQGEAEALAQSKIDHAIQTFTKRRREIEALHEQFMMAKCGEMDERKRDEFRSKLKLIYLQNCLAEEETALRVIEIIDQSFYQALDSDTFETLEEFEKYFKEYLAHRLEVHLDCVRGNRELEVLIRQDEGQEATLTRLDVKEDVQKIKAREEAAKAKASDELAKMREARTAYQKAATVALGEFLRKSVSVSYDSFKLFLATKGLPVTTYEDVLEEIWAVRDGILFSMQEQEAAAQREAQKKADEVLAKKEEMDRERRAVREKFLARIEREQAELKQRAVEEELAKKLAAEEAQRKAREEAEAAAEKERFTQRIREKYQADLEAKVAELRRLAAQKDAKK